MCKQAQIYVIMIIISGNMLPDICDAHILDQLCKQAVLNMSQSYEMGNVHAIGLNIQSPEVTKAFEMANGELPHPYRISNAANISIGVNIEELREKWWERPYRYIIMHAYAKKDNNIIWSNTICSSKEMMHTTRAIMIRIAIAILLWPLIVTYCFYMMNCSLKKEKYFKGIWMLAVLILIWSYIGPTYLY